MWAQLPSADCEAPLFCVIHRLLTPSSIGIERIGYALGVLLGLPVLETYLEVLDGHACSVQRRVQQGISWRQLNCFPLMEASVANADIHAKAALFDVWLGNTSRRDVNLLFEPCQPASSERVRRAAGCG
jgi:hypothetical protein